MSTYDKLLEGIQNRVSLKALSLLYVEHVLTEVGANKVKAADVLAIDRRTIQRWVRNRWIEGGAARTVTEPTRRQMRIDEVPIPRSI